MTNCILNVSIVIAFYQLLPEGHCLAHVKNVLQYLQYSDPFGAQFLYDNFTMNSQQDSSKGGGLI